MEAKQPSVEQLQVLVRDALKVLYGRDRDLIRRSVHEASIAHRLAVYLEILLYQQLDLSPFDQSGYDVDVEYNRNGRETKRLVRGKRGKRPDIIIHERGSNENNLLIIEIKKNEPMKNGNSDDSKLCGATDENHDFRYKLGLYLSLTHNTAELIWYRNGQKVDHEKILQSLITQSILERLKHGK